jgi:hypothetical protein
MSGTKVSRIEPTAEQRRAMNEHQLARLRRRRQGQVDWIRQLAADWVSKVPASAGWFSEIDLHDLPEESSRDLSYELGVTARLVADTDNAIKKVVERCIAEEVRLERRKGATASVIARSKRASVKARGHGVAAGRHEVDLGHEEAIIEPVHRGGLPEPEERISRVEEVLARSTGSIPGDEMRSLMDAAADATTITAYRSVRSRARAAVAVADAEAAKCCADRSEALQLLGCLAGLRSAEVESLSESLGRVIGGDLPLGPGTAAQVERAAGSAKREMFLSVMRSLGYEDMPAADGSVRGFIPLGEGRGSIVSLRGDRVTIVPASSAPLSKEEAVALDEGVCEVHKALRERAPYGVVLESSRGIGKVPPRIVELPSSRRTRADATGGHGNAGASSAARKPETSRARRRLNDELRKRTR